MVNAVPRAVPSKAYDGASPVGGPGPSGRTFSLTKHEGAGNDFLVLLDPDRSWEPSAAQVRAACDRTRGVGADGLIVGRRSGSGRGAPPEARGSDGPVATDLEMELFNADGTRAEMSGNGVRCLVQAAVDAGLVAPGTVRVSTAAGVRSVAYAPREAGVGEAEVEMGAVRLGAEVPSPLAGTRARAADVGNPHLVLVGDVDLASLDMGALGSAAEEIVGSPVNVEVVRPGPEPGSLSLRVHERGVGETSACGTGSCAAAAVARAYGLVGDRVEVVNPGGRLVVALGAGAAGHAVLSGTVRHVADVVVDEGLVARA